MGWYAEALKGGRYVDINTDEQARSVFALAAQTAMLRGGVDVFLEKGGVHLSRCREFLRQAAGRDINHEILTPEEVVRLNRDCVWPSESLVDEDRLGAYWSIRILISTCADNGYGLEVNL